MNALLLTTLTRFAHLPIARVDYAATGHNPSAEALTVELRTCAAFHAAAAASDARIHPGPKLRFMLIATAPSLRLEHICTPECDSLQNAPREADHHASTPRTT